MQFSSNFRWTWLKVLSVCTYRDAVGSLLSDSLRRGGLAGNGDLVIISLVMLIETLTVEKFAWSEWLIGKRLTSEARS